MLYIYYSQFMSGNWSFSLKIEVTTLSDEATFNKVYQSINELLKAPSWSTAVASVQIACFQIRQNDPRHCIQDVTKGCSE